MGGRELRLRSCVWWGQIGEVVLISRLLSSGFSIKTQRVRDRIVDLVVTLWEALAGRESWDTEGTVLV
jgi:hypothetical protein